MTLIKTNKYIQAISKSGLTIYDPIEIGDPQLWVPSVDLEKLISTELTGFSLEGLPLRTRSKIVKEKICVALGYSIPKSFIKTNPRFPGQNFDTYVQKSNNLQVWNEELSPTRRYVIIKVDLNNIITKVKVVNGDTLAILDTTGTLTQKYQARLVVTKQKELLSEDTEKIKSFTKNFKDKKFTDPTEYPSEQSLLPIDVLFKKLSTIIGKSFKNAGQEQERNRGADLHKLACQSLGYKIYKDNGKFPDICNQLLEIKLQTSTTIDLGLVTPDSESALDLPMINNDQLKHCDVRYGIFYGNIEKGMVTITNFYLVSGKDFYKSFPKFGGKVLNKKLQIPLPETFFDSTPKA